MTIGSLYENAVSEVKPKISKKEKKPFLPRGGGTGGGKGCSGPRKIYKKALVFTSGERVEDNLNMPPKVRAQPIENKNQPKGSEQNDSVLTKNSAVEKRSESRSKVGEAKVNPSNLKQKPKTSFASNCEPTPIDFFQSTHSEAKSESTHSLKKNNWRNDKANCVESKVKESPSIELRNESETMPKERGKGKKVSYFDDSESDSKLSLVKCR